MFGLNDGKNGAGDIRGQMSNDLNTTGRHTGIYGQDQKRIPVLRIILDSVRIVLGSVRMPAGQATAGKSCEATFETPFQFYRLNPYAIFRHMRILWPSTCLVLTITTTLCSTNIDKESQGAAPLSRAANHQSSDALLEVADLT